MTSPSGTMYKLARGRLDLIRDVWNQDHQEAMACLDFEAFLQAAVEVFDYFDGLFMQRRLGVFQAQIAPNSDLDANEREVYRLWNELADEIAAELASYERNYDVDGAETFRHRHATGTERFANWTPASLSKAIGFRADELDEDSAEELRRLVEDGGKSGEGRLRMTPLSLPLGDPDLLRNRRRQAAG